MTRQGDYIVETNGTDVIVRQLGAGEEIARAKTKGTEELRSLICSVLQHVGWVPIQLEDSYRAKFGDKLAFSDSVRELEIALELLKHLQSYPEPAK